MQGTANNFFTVSGGIRSATISQVEWDTQKTAAKAYKAVTGPKDPKRVADEWKRLSMLQLDSLSIQDRRALGAIKNNQMLFVGLLRDGSIDAQVATFSFDGKEFGITVVRPPMNQVRSIAEGEKAAKEFLLHQSPEAKLENERWRASLKSTFGVRTPEDFQTELVMKLVDWAIKHPPTVNGIATVGGQVEAVKLQPNSTITWLRPCPTSKAVPKNHR